MILNLLLVIAAYLLGSIPSAVWIGKRFYGVDVRRHGSHNAGATNTLRVLGRRAAVPVFALDFLKGYAAVSLEWLTSYHNLTPQMYNLEMALAAAAVLGHMFPVFAGFRGGKGVATLSGAVTAMYPLAVLICLGIFVAVYLVTKYVSLGSMAAGVCFPFILVFVFGATYPHVVLFGVAIAVLLLATHRKNFRRLIDGTETKTYFFNRCKHPSGHDEGEPYKDI